MLVNKFYKNESGSISALFATSMMLAFGVGGVSVDFTRMLNAKQQAQHVLDASLLAAATEFQNSGSIKKAEELGVKYMTSILPDIDEKKLNITVKNNFITGSYHGEINNTILAIFLKPTTQWSIEAKINQPNKVKTDFALAVDVSSSMVTKGLLDGLRKSLSDFSKQVYKQSKTGEITVSVAPFSNSVSFAPKFEKWVDKKNGYSQTNKFNGCFEYSPLGNKNALDKTNNSKRKAAFPRKTSKGVPFCTKSQSNAAFYIDNETDLTAKLAGLTTGQGTNTAEGLTWAWRMLTPAWQDTIGESNIYPREESSENKKVIILLTDGKPYNIPSVKIPKEDKDQARKKALTEFEKVCAQIVTAGNIDLYTIVYGNVMSQLQTKAIRKCIAGNGRSYHGGTQDQLSAILSQIVSRNRALALSK